VISADNKILLVKGRASQKWSFPKGHMERNESSLQCATRELFEETGVVVCGESIAFKKYSAAGYFIYSVPNELPLYPKDMREIQDAQWYSLEDLEKLNKNVDVSMFCQHLSKGL
jgi:8-oxo-dGTP pyrophosphatase MutT (NUDIX family)